MRTFWRVQRWHYIFSSFNLIFLFLFAHLFLWCPSLKSYILLCCLKNAYLLTSQALTWVIKFALLIFVSSERAMEVVLNLLQIATYECNNNPNIIISCGKCILPINFIDTLVQFIFKIISAHSHTHYFFFVARTC